MRWVLGRIPFYIRRPRQVIGLLYLSAYLSIFFYYAILRTDPSWTIQSKFFLTVIVWFALSLAVKVSMVIDRTVELLNLVSLLAFLAIAFTYNPLPALLNTEFSSVENFCYYLYLIGGSACDFFDFLYESAAKRPEDAASPKS